MSAFKFVAQDNNTSASNTALHFAAVASVCDMNTSHKNSTDTNNCRLENSDWRNWRVTYHTSG